MVQLLLCNWMLLTSVSMSLLFHLSVVQNGKKTLIFKKLVTCPQATSIVDLQRALLAINIIIPPR